MFTSVSTDKVSVSYVDERGCYGRGTLLRWRCFSMDTVKVSSCRLVSFVCSLLHTTKRYTQRNLIIMADDEEVQPLVIDNGSGMCKAGARIRAHASLAATT